MEQNLDTLRNGIFPKDGKIKPIYKSGAYIENQSEWGNVKFGKSNMSYSGCEIIAVYNALKALGENGYEVTATAELDAAVIDEIGERSDTIIVSAYNDKDDITAMIHTVSISKEKTGTYSVHNAYYMNAEGEYAARCGYGTLQEAINVISNKKPKSIDVIGISKQ